MSLVIFDTETTGLPVQTSNKSLLEPKNYKYYDSSRLVEIAYIVYEKNSANDWEIVKKNSLIIKPDNFIIENEKFHGISNEIAEKDGKEIGEVFRIFQEDISSARYLVAHNMKFDINIILAEAYRYNKTTLIKSLKSMKKICTIQQSMKTLNLKRYLKLKDLYNMLFDKYPEVELHRALNDTEICAECFFALKNT
tara:strand:+ start:2399 stop:2983 length:585 start_codon:yes stop_codon:yes gene_type:complete